jgi:hypothetical protein
LDEIQGAFAGIDLDDVETTLVKGLTAFLRGVAASPEVYRLVFFQEGGGNAAIANRIRRGRGAQVDFITDLTGRWLGARSTEAKRTARLLAHAIVGLAEAGARALLEDPKTWTPELLGRKLGTLAFRGRAAI